MRLCHGCTGRWLCLCMITHVCLCVEGWYWCEESFSITLHCIHTGRASELDPELTDMDKPSTGMTGGCASKSTQSSIYMGSLGWNLVLRLAACMLSAWTAQLSPELSLCKVLCSRVLQPHAFIWSRSEMKAYSIQPARWINGKFIVTKSEDLSFIPPKLQC